MLNITRFTCEGLQEGCVTDRLQPRFSFSLESNLQNTELKLARLRVSTWQTETNRQIAIPYQGEALRPFTKYEAAVTAEDNHGQLAGKALVFETGRLGTPWKASWISDSSYRFTEKKVSPLPMKFRKDFTFSKPVVSARIYAAAIGIYELALNGKKVGDQYFAPGFTSYRTNLQYQTYDVTEQLKEHNTLTAVVAGGWAVGSFVYTRVNRVTADRQALLLELRVDYADGTEEVFGTDESWDVTEESAYRMADLYDGETFDATIEDEQIAWRKASVEKLPISPAITAAYGAPVRAHEHFKPISCAKVNEELIYDFGQNFAGVVSLKLTGKKGQKITVRHAEILNPDGTLNTAFLRTAKATTTYICRDGEQRYSPCLTYMGFRYISVEGIEEENLEVEAIALYSDLQQIGEFSCSDAQLNRLQQNILWGAKSNLVDIPTDCPQRDERMGWTGDIAVFAPTACFNFDMGRFLEKWLLDVEAEQLPTGGIPNTIPSQGFVFPVTMPKMAVDWWGDASVLVPWALYQAQGDESVLKRFYPMMKKYVNACRFWAGLLSFGKHQYLWNTHASLHFGDWVAPDIPQMKQWQKRSKWTATASLCNTSALLSKIAGIIGEQKDAAYYAELSRKVADAYISILTDGKGRLLEEFQTAYVLPLYFGMFPHETEKTAADNLARLVKQADYCVSTGFPGTPYVLFALADHGHADTAFRMLMNTKCPSWLYEVKMGATTIWERWDGLDENGICPISDDGTDLMISYNHYASGAVGDFLYRRVVGIEALEPGYKRFLVKPLIGGGLSFAQAAVQTPYGRAGGSWRLEGDTLYLQVEVPVGCRCQVELPNREPCEIRHGVYSFETRLS